MTTLSGNALSKLTKHILMGCAFVLLGACQGNEFSSADELQIGNRDLIFGGTRVLADSETAQYVVGIRFSGPEGADQICTGSWIAKDWILTAAHCIPENMQDLEVYQTTNIESPADALPLKRVIVYPTAAAMKIRLLEKKRYDIGNKYDIALIQVSESKPHSFLQISDFYSPTQLVNSAEEKVPLSVAGFGAQNIDVLSGVVVQNPHLEEVILEVPNTLNRNVVHVPQTGPQGVCVGDSGAPLMRKENGRMIIYGMASSVRNPGSSEICKGESRFIQLSRHKNWINSFIAKSW